MTIVSFFLFYGFKSTLSLYFILLFFIVLGFAFISIYRIFFIHFIFKQDSFIFKSLFKTIEFKKKDIKDVFLISMKKRMKYNLFDKAINDVEEKMYLVISRQPNLLEAEDVYKFSFFSIANNNRMILEYSKGMLPYFEDLKLMLYVQKN